VDVNAGLFLDGYSMDVVGKNLFDLTRQVVEGRRTCGEKAGHAQVSIWRNWSLTSIEKLEELLKLPSTLPGLSYPTKNSESIPANNSTKFRAIKTSSGEYVTDQVGLVLPTSLCSGQIAAMIAKKLNEEFSENPNKSLCVSKFFALPHTEGCGVSDGSAETIYRRTILGHLVSPLVKYCVLLEHGCEKTHNAYMVQHISKEMGLTENLFGFASVQLDGGIEAVTDKVMQLFISKLISEPQPARVEVGLQHLRIVFISLTQLSDPLSRILANIAQQITHCGGLLVVPSNSGLTNSRAFMLEMLDLLPGQSVKPSLAYGQKPVNNGFHVMETLSDNWAETLTGLGATGVEIMLYVAEGRHITRSTPSHPMIPLLRVANPAEATITKSYKETLEDFDLVLDSDSSTWEESLLQVIIDVASHIKRPKISDNTDFQISRGPLGISM